MESGERRLTNLQLANLAAILRCLPEEIPVIQWPRPGRGRAALAARRQQEVVGSSIASGAAAAGYVLAQLRKKHGKTMQQVADAIGMTLSVYHRMEMASRMIQGEEIDKVAELYGMTEEALIGLFERRTADNLEQLRNGVPIEQLLPRVPRSLLKEGNKWGRLGCAGALRAAAEHPLCRRAADGTDSLAGLRPHEDRSRRGPSFCARP